MFCTPSQLQLPRPSRRRSSLRVAAVLAGLAGSLLSAASAQAALVSTSACNDSALSQPFHRWGDSSTYQLVSGGDFEGSLTGWTTSAGAQRVAGSEPYGATGSVGSYSLKLATGAWAQSPYTCVDAAYPTFRFFARNDTFLASVLVQVVYQTPVGTVALPLGAVALSGTWQPTLPMLTGSVLAGALSGGTAQVALRFTALTGSSQIDDVFIDPHMH
ncbi:MAG: hypothetical protein JWN10_990 [Solirubrobacterales bacterium]|nr:hypothetical protein [Solirubrobacterales bacterium]